MVLYEIICGNEEKLTAEEIFRVCRNMMYHTAYDVLHNRKDAVADALVKICRNLEKFQGRAPDEWKLLARICDRNTAIDHYRRNQNRKNSFSGVCVYERRDEKDQRNSVRKQKRISLGFCRRAAAVSAAVVLLAGISCAAVEPIREKIAGIFLRQEDEIMFVQFASSAEGPETTQGYIPDGFSLTYRNAGEADSSLTCTYGNDQGQWLYVSKLLYKERDDMQYAYKEETFEAESAVAGGREYLILRPKQENGTHPVMWSEDGYAFALETTLSEEEMMKIAAGVTVDCKIFE